MAVDLPKEFSKYCAETKHLRRILKHTQACFQDINNAGVFEGNQIVSAELSQDEENEITANTKRVPGIVIFGQTNSAKAFVVNEIFNEPILPSSHDTAPWRDIVFKHGARASLSFVLPNSYELLVAEEHQHLIEGPWTTVPLDQLAVEKEEFSVDQAYEHAVLEVKLKHPLLKEGGVVRVARTYDPALGKDGVMDIYSMCTDRVIPVIVYAIAHNLLCEQEVQFLQHLRDLAPRIPIFFIKVPPPRLPPDDDADAKMDTTPHHDDGDNISPDTPFSRQDAPLAPERETSQDSGLDNSSELDKERYRHSMYFTDKEADAISLFQQLVQLGYLSIMPERRVSGLQSLSCSTDSYGCDSELVEGVANFGAGIVHFTHQVLRTYLLQTISLLILVHERCLQNFIMRAFDMARDMQITPRKLEFAKRKEIELYSSLMEIAVKKQDEIRKIIEVTVEDKRDELLQKAEDYDFIGADILETGEVRSARDLKICTGQIQELVLSALNSAIAGKVLGSVDILKDSYTGVLTRCLESLEQSDAYSAESLHTSLALREILHAAYQVEITVRSGASVVRFLLEKMKQLVAAAMPWSSWPRVDAGFKRRVAGNMLDSLNSARLAASICSQIKEKLKQSHDQFAAALNQLESRHSTRLGQTEEKRMKVRKVFAPRVARLVLESTSLRDYINFDMPALGREVGRGQYGVVYSCEAWAGHSPCAVKSVVPPDDKHWNDLALEFFYTKHVPEHERLVALRGSVIDYTYGSGSAAVLLIMDRLQRDLYTAIRAGLGWINRLQVAIDVVEGIRYLHSQGLVHRDIKLKNVLLDGAERGKLTDLGFCKPEAMMSGSIVGTPIHMAPELFSGKYDNSVDVYAFGILFWYICAGHVKLPYAFEQCANKEMLWTSVKQGVRPEKLSQFSSECWSLMSTCWESESHRRPLVGQVHARLNAIIEKERARKPARVMSPRRRNVKSPTRPTTTEI